MTRRDDAAAGRTVRPNRYGDEALPPENGRGTAALALGIASLVFALLAVLFGPLPAIISIIAGVIAIFCGVTGRRRVRRSEATNGRAATGGLVTGIVGTILVLAFIAYSVIFYVQNGQQVLNCLHSTAHKNDRSYCLQHYGDPEFRS